MEIKPIKCKPVHPTLIALLEWQEREIERLYGDLPDVFRGRENNADI